VLPERPEDYVTKDNPSERLMSAAQRYGVNFRSGFSLCGDVLLWCDFPLSRFSVIE
jgi:hypothetical protein